MKTDSEEQMCRDGLRAAKLVVVKVGSSSLSDKLGNIDFNKIKLLCEELSRLKKQGTGVILVSSGAIRSGRAVVSNFMKNGEIPRLQAFAAIGQVLLMEAYRDAMALKGFNVAQILLTWDDFRNRSRLKNLLNTLNTLLSFGIVPIINENDTISTDEIKFGDNDTLSALVTVNMGADLLVILSDVDGLYTGDPGSPGTRLISFVESITPEIERLASDKFGGFGGMATKLKAARMVNDAGIPMVIANGANFGILEEILAGKRVGTIFRPREAR